MRAAPTQESLPQYQLDLNAERRKAFVAKTNALLAEARERIIHHRPRTAGLEACRRYAHDMDLLLRGVYKWIAAEARLEPKDYGRVAIVAQGGYGRGQLNLHSDVDLLFLLPEKPTPVEQAFVKSFLYILWDLNKLDLGYSTKKAAEALMAVGTDLDSTTALMQTRLVAGNAEALAQLRSKLEKLLRGSHRRWFVESKLAECATRRAKYGDSVYLLEPNLKDSEGGLRDVHSVQWLSFVLLGAMDLRVLVEKDVLESDELRAVTTALNFILALRTMLHSAEDRKIDTLTFDKQPKVAALLGYKADSQLLAEEKLMRDYYLNARQIDRYTQKATRIMTARARSKLGGIMDAMRRRPVNEHYYAKDGVLFLKTAGRDFFRQDPARAMEVFLVAAQNGLVISDELKDLLTAAHKYTDTDEFRSSERCRDLFMRLLGLKRHAAAAVHAMHETGVLADYLPEFRKLFCLVRIDHYHRYTVDEHLIKTLEVSEALINGGEGQRPELVQAAREIWRWDLLNLALLLHDIGKGEGHGHVLRGAGISEQITQRMGLDPEERETVRLLVLLHLKMAHVSQRRDLDDPHTIRDMAAAVPSVDLLRMLYVLTYCDTRAVGPTTWNDWKASLLYDLYRKTALALEGKNPIPVIDEAAFNRLAVMIREGAGGRASDAQIERFLNSVPQKYLNVVSPRRMAAHMLMLECLRDDTRIHYEVAQPEGVEYTEITTVSFDKPGFMSLVCMALASKNINILSVQAFSTKDGHIIDIFQVTDARGNRLPQGFRLDRLMNDLNRVLLGKAKAEEVFVIRHPARPRLDASAVKPAQILVDNEASPDFTVIEVKAPDRPGLLYDVTSAFACNRCNIHLALITTEAYRVVDVFYVTDLDYNKLESLALKKLTAALEKVIQ
ncbi:MAG: [protein-PII] uridylyltransferase [Candidatus Sumerlaeaceae bacterium]|nr:[protein-PII] uridylyltransferase [Candidatus Sumerlaeaceae bacterium]